MISSPSKWTFRSFLVFLGALTAFVVINPLYELDIFALMIAFLAIAYLFLSEKLILAFLLVRPTLDYFRDFHIISFQATSINLNAAFSLLLTLWCLMILLKYRVHLKASTVHVGAIGVLIVSVMTLLSSVSFGTSIVEILKLLNVFLIFFVGYILYKARKITLHEISLAFLWSLLIPILVALFQLITSTGMDTDDVRNRIYGTVAHPNVFAFLILLGLMMLSRYAKQIPHKYLYIIYTLGCFLLLFTYTRAALIGLLIFFMVIGWYRFRKPLLIGVSVVAICYGLFFPINSLITHTTNYDLTDIGIIGRLTTRSEDADSLSWRTSVIQQSIPLGIKRLWTGYGYGTFPMVWEDERGQEHIWDAGKEAHNDYLRMFVELGIFGLFFYIIFLGSLAGQSFGELHYKQNSDKILFFAILITFLALSFSDNMLNHTPLMWPLWFYLGALFAKDFQHELLGWQPENIRKN
ncbi:O-antigen ligase family protein [Candidatus Nomurabacteria bacterium]|nr:O-antigen ligase family protein [Candidatus Nomurabacteria bacterium]